MPRVQLHQAWVHKRHDFRTVLESKTCALTATLNQTGFIILGLGFDNIPNNIHLILVADQQTP